MTPLSPMHSILLMSMGGGGVGEEITTRELGERGLTPKSHMEDDLQLLGTSRGHRGGSG